MEVKISTRRTYIAKSHKPFRSSSDLDPSTSSSSSSIQLHPSPCARNYGKDRLTGKVAIVTGAASGIGRATSILFARQGAKVCCADVTKTVEDTVESITAELGPGIAMAQLCDVGNEAEVAQLVDACCKEFGSVDICFANAGVPGSFEFFTEIRAENISDVFRVNVNGVIYLFKHVAKKMVEQQTQGSMIATSSVAGVRSGAGDTVYSASKAAVISICETAANQFTGTGIRCNAICPGIIETNMTKPAFDMADSHGTRSKIGQLNPLLRYGDPEEMASVALFLASDDSSYVNGQAIRAAGDEARQSAGDEDEWAE